MNQYGILDADEYRRKKINFWFVWTIGNAFGAATGWAFGEMIGRIASESFGIRTGLLIATLIFEIFVWLPRITISRYFHELNLLGYFEMMIWMTTEIIICVMVDLLPPNDVTWLTLGAGIANVMGSMMSMLLLIIGLSDVHLVNPAKQGKKSIWWVMKTTLKALVSFAGIAILLFTIMAVSTKIGNNVQMFPPVIGWALSGLLFGGGIGAITGLGYVTLISRRDSMLS